MPHRHDAHVLNDLIGATLDSADRLERAVDRSDSSGHSDLFAALATERRGLAATLQQSVRDLGHEPHDTATLLAKTQRAVADIGQALMGEEADRVGSIDRAEAALDRRYEQAIADEKLSATTRETLRRAHALIHREADDVHGLHRSLDSRRDAESGLFPQ